MSINRALAYQEKLADFKRREKELAREIAFLEYGKVIHDNVKLDISRLTGGRGSVKWTLSFLNRHDRWNGRTRTVGPAAKWVPVYCSANREDVIRKIPEIIRELQALYDAAIRQVNDKGELSDERKADFV